MCIHYRCYKLIILKLDCLYPCTHDIGIVLMKLKNLNEQNVKYFYVINPSFVY